MTVVNVDDIEAGKAKRLDQLATIAEVEIKTFPVIFFNEIYIGGFTESKEVIGIYYIVII